ncbi:MAG: ArsB/NhaD family transporter [Methylococcales bacterium]
MLIEANVLTPHMYLAASILLGAYVLIFTEIMYRTSAAIVGAVVMVGVGTATGFYSQEAAVVSIDANTLFLLLAMMLLVAIIRPTGGFEYVGIKLAKIAGGNPRRLLVYLSLAVSVLSMFLDNVTTVIIFAPLTVLITRMLNLNPVPYLIAEAMLSNIGGATTLVGDPPNIMIGSAAEFDFYSFLTHMGPIIVPVWMGTVLLMLFLFRHDLRPRNGSSHSIDLDESKAIKDKAGLLRASVALVVVIVLFFIHHRVHLFPAYVAWIGVAIALLLSKPNPEALIAQVEWSTLLFFAALFIIVGGVEASGLLALVGQLLAENTHDPDTLVWSALTLMWVAALLSAMVDNIPFTVTMIPIVAGLETQGVNVNSLWWALAIGVGLGGNATHIGATANIICIAEAERSGHPEARITPLRWMRIGVPVMFISLILASGIFVWSFARFLV